MERVCVIGAGAIGSLFAGHLAAVADVSVLTRREDHAEALRRDGLRISGRSERQATVPPPPIPTTCGLRPRHRRDQGGRARGCGRFAARALPRGDDHDRAERPRRRGGRARGGAWPIISGVTFMSGTRHSDTHVEYVLDTETWLGPYEDTPFAVVRRPPR